MPAPCPRLALHGGEPIRTRPWPARAHIGTEEKAAVDALFDEALATGTAIGYGGTQSEAYAAEFAALLGSGCAHPVNSGTTALYVALRALDLAPGSEVVVGAVTDPGGIMPITLAGCVPIVADTAPDSFNTGPAEIAARLTPRTRAIVVPHIGGEPAAMEEIAVLARRHECRLIEDCAQAHGARLRGRPLGTFGDVATFSTMFGKHCCTGGQGGMVYTENRELHQRVRWMADRGKPYGLPAGTGHQVASLNFNLDELHCAIGRAQLRKLPATVARRRALANAVFQACTDLDTLAQPATPAGAEPSYWFLRLRLRLDRMNGTKSEYLDSLSAEGMAPVFADYAGAAAPWTSPWFRTCAATEPVVCPNWQRVDANHFRLEVHEAWRDADVRDAIRILTKVDNAFRAPR